MRCGRSSSRRCIATDSTGDPTRSPPTSCSTPGSGSPDRIDRRVISEETAGAITVGRHRSIWRETGQPAGPMMEPTAGDSDPSVAVGGHGGHRGCGRASAGIGTVPSTHRHGGLPGLDTRPTPLDDRRRAGVGSSHGEHQVAQAPGDGRPSGPAVLSRGRRSRGLRRRSPRGRRACLLGGPGPRPQPVRRRRPPRPVAGCG